MDNIISTIKITKNYNKNKIINNLNLNVEEKSFTTIIGPRGEGKTTLINLLSGIITPDSGEIMFNNKIISNMKDTELTKFRRENCGFIFNNTIFLDNISILDNLIITSKLYFNSNDKIKNKIEELSKELEIKEELSKTIKDLSNMSIANIELLRSLISSPKVLFIDEGISLNNRQEEKFLNTLNNLNEKGQTIIMTTTNKRVALRSERVIYLSEGKILGELKLGKYQEVDKKRKEKLERFLKEMGW